MNEKLAALRKQLISKTKDQVKEAYSGQDQHIVNAVSTLDDLDVLFNMMSEHARNWYAIHFPEINEVLDNHEHFLKIIVDVGKRSKMNEKNLMKIIDNKEKVEKVLKKADGSMGSDFDDKDLKQIKLLAENALKLKDERNELEGYVTKEMEKLAPNVTKIAGPLIGARLISHLGSFKKLAVMPSSTVQVLGAEKALFQHIQRGSKPPKYGLIFMHPMIMQMKAWQKGKISRTLANKISLAAKEDYFGKDDISKQLLSDLEIRIKEIQEKEPTPPKNRKSKVTLPLGKDPKKRGRGSRDSGRDRGSRSGGRDRDRSGGRDRGSRGGRDFGRDSRSGGRDSGRGSRDRGSRSGGRDSGRGGRDRGSRSGGRDSGRGSKSKSGGSKGRSDKRKRR